MLSENKELLLHNKEILWTFDGHFGSIVNNLGLDHWNDNSLSLIQSLSMIEIVRQSINHPNIKNKTKCNSIRIFSF